MSTQLPPKTRRRIEAISVEDALKIVLDVVGPMPVIERSAGDSVGYVLASEVRSQVDLPAFRNSAMDGYALRSSDTAGASTFQPKQVTVVGSTAAGDTAWSGSLEVMTAVRVMTGAPLPADADTVVRFEDVEERGRHILISTAIPRGTNVREVGSDLSRGAVAVSSGRASSWSSSALLISIGVRNVHVFARPVVAVISTGDELRAHSNNDSSSAVPDSNGPMLVELVRDAGAEPIFAGVARDSRDSLERAIAGVEFADAIIVSGGVSAGDRDAVRDLLMEREGIIFSQVRMKPGRPFTFGRLDSKPIFALPGNPFAAAATFLQFVQPALDRMRGRTIDANETRYAEVASRIENPGNRRQIVPVRLRSRSGKLPLAERIVADISGLALLARADGLLVIPESTKSVEAGNECEYWPLPR